MKVLLSEGSSLTAREHLTVLGRAGVHVDILSSIGHPLCEFSRWTSKVHRAPSPSAYPLGYLTAVRGLVETGEYDALLPTHEQAWLFAVGKKLLPTDVPLAVAPAEAFDRVQGKAAFCVLLDELGSPSLTGPKLPIQTTSQASVSLAGSNRTSRRPDAASDWSTTKPPPQQPSPTWSDLFSPRCPPQELTHKSARFSTVAA